MRRDQVIIFVMGMVVGALVMWALLNHLGGMGPSVGPKASGPDAPEVDTVVGEEDSGLKALPQAEARPPAPAKPAPENEPEVRPSPSAKSAAGRQAPGSELFEDVQPSSGSETPPTGKAEEPGDDTIVWDPGREGIQAAIQENTEEFLHCFEAWLAVQPDMAGTLVVSFAIAVPEGADPDDGARVVGVTPEDSDLENAFMEGCVLAVFEELRFAAPEDGGEIQVRYPLKFSPE